MGVNGALARWDYKHYFIITPHRRSRSGSPLYLPERESIHTPFKKQYSIHSVYCPVLGECPSSLTSSNSCATATQNTPRNHISCQRETLFEILQSPGSQRPMNRHKKALVGTGRLAQLLAHQSAPCPQQITMNQRSPVLSEKHPHSNNKANGTDGGSRDRPIPRIRMAGRAQSISCAVVDL